MSVQMLLQLCGLRFNIVRYFVYYLRVRLKVVPWNYDFTKEVSLQS